MVAAGMAARVNGLDIASYRRVKSASCFSSFAVNEFTMGCCRLMFTEYDASIQFVLRCCDIALSTSCV